MKQISTLALVLAVASATTGVAMASGTETATATPETRDDGESPYVLGPADVLEVFVWKEPELSTQVAVRPDGRIALPLAGELVAAGSTPVDLERRITARLDEFIETPLVTVIVKEVNHPKFSVLGEVRRPGRYSLSQRTTIVDAIAIGGGFTEYADRGKVTVLRQTTTGARRITVDVKRLLKNGRAPLVLEPGDAIHVD